MTAEEKARRRIALQNVVFQDQSDNQKFKVLEKFQGENVTLLRKKSAVEQKAVAVLSKQLSNIPRTFEHTALDKALNTLTTFPDISRMVGSVGLGITGAVVMFPNPTGALVMVVGFAAGLGVGHSVHKFIERHHGADTAEERSTHRQHVRFNLEKLKNVSEPLRHCMEQLEVLTDDADIPVWFWLKCNRQLEQAIEINNVYQNHSVSLLAQWKELSKPDPTAQKSIEDLKIFMQKRGWDVPAPPTNTIEVEVAPEVKTEVEPSSLKRLKL